MRYLYKETETGYEQLLSAAREAETEWIESKTIKVKATSVVDSGKKERDELKARIDKLTKELNKKEKGSFFKKKTGIMCCNSPPLYPYMGPFSMLQTYPTNELFGVKALSIPHSHYHLSPQHMTTISPSTFSP